MGLHNIGYRPVVGRQDLFPFPMTQTLSFVSRCFACSFFHRLSSDQLPAEHLSDHEVSGSPKYRAKQSRFYNHVLLSECTRKALKNVIRVKRVSLATAGILAVIALVISCSAGAVPPIAAASATSVGGLFKRGWAGIATAVGGAVALGVGAAAQKLEGRFYENFERHPVLE